MQFRDIQLSRRRENILKIMDYHDLQKDLAKITLKN